MWSLFFIVINMQALLGKKIEQSQRFLEDGTRIPVTTVYVAGNSIAGIKTEEKDKYNAIQLGFGTKKNPKVSLVEHAKKAKLKNTPSFLREVRLQKEDVKNLPKVGEQLHAQDIFKPGDIVHVRGISKGKGFAGVVKRHHFKGGPRTHGQSDRERAPGAIGSTTTPGRVYKGKRMAGRMGQDRVTVKNLQIVDASDDLLVIKGLVPGGRNSLVVVEKVGEAKKFIPLYEEVSKEDPKETKGTKREEKEEVKENAKS